ncbi:hypothetical protein [Lacrimispora sp.]|jgi:hypothetical protein|uniref:hypothetical protein n=1 Tax=Lacrimispora sp. TaxID=2719234 RepID=UPI0028A215ED|nr:hypothetical protein [Lacrimispora sp.]
MPKRKIYAVYDEGERIGSYTPEVAEMVIGIPKNKVSGYATQKSKYKKRYTFIPEELEYKKEVERIENDWNFTVRALPLMLGRKAHGKG